DGKTDILAVEGRGSAAPMSIYLSNGDGTFSAPIPGPVHWVDNLTAAYARGSIARVHTTGDFNGDGKTDIAIVRGSDAWTPMAIYLAVSDGLGGLTFEEHLTGPSEYVTRVSSVWEDVDLARVFASGDFDGDGCSDIASVPRAYGSAAPMAISLSN